MPEAVPVDALMALSTMRRLALVLTGVCDASVTDASNLVLKLQPAEGYTEIEFESSSLTLFGIKDMIGNLNNRNVLIQERLTIQTSVTISRQDELDLRSKAKATLFKTNCACTLSM
nr:uncharacterized protein LOC128705363 [Cherax quadricarinatus]